MLFEKYNSFYLLGICNNTSELPNSRVALPSLVEVYYFIEIVVFFRLFELQPTKLKSAW